MAQIIKPTNLSLTWASGGDVLNPGDTKYATGWQVEVPPRQWFNYLDNRQDTAIAHINQHGVAVWDAGTEYQANKSYCQGPTNGTIYRCVSTHTNQNPETDVTNVYWTIAFASAGDSYTKTETDGLYLSKAANGSDILNAATFRNNISVYSQAQTYTKTEVDGAFLSKAANGSDILNAATFRNNLGVYSTTDADARYARLSQNLNDLPNKATARNNLGVYSQAQTYTKTEVDGAFLSKAANGSDILNAATFRNNISVYSQAQTYTKTEVDGAFLSKAANGSDILNAATFRNNLGAAPLASPTFTGTVTAPNFRGNGSELTSLNASNLGSGTVPDARLSGTYTGVNITGNAATATKLQTARTINGVAFDGTANITVTDSTRLPLTGGTLTGTLTAAAFIGDGSQLTGLSVLGVGQTWQDVTGSRAIGTNYTNTTGRPITVSAWTTYTHATAGVSVMVNGVIIAHPLGDWDAGGGRAWVTAIIPPGAVYQLQATPGISAWCELR